MIDFVQCGVEYHASFTKQSLSSTLEKSLAVTNIVIFKNNKVLKITITTREGESKQTHSHRRDVTQNRIIFDDGYSWGALRAC
jgi:hypothetical protein